MNSEHVDPQSMRKTKKRKVIDRLKSEWTRSTCTSYFTINIYIYIYIHTHGTWLIEISKGGAPTCVHDLIESVDQLHVLLERD